MKILVTGAAGFIGYHVCEILLRENFTVVGLDNINDYYDVNLKFSRLKELGIHQKEAEKFHSKATGKLYKDQFSFYRMNLEDRDALPKLFADEKFDMVCNLAAQAGVRYSLEEPNIYVDSNVVGFLNILECCRHNSIKHLVYASSSSVYGNNEKIPFSVDDNVDHPISLYAATKKSNELMANAYSHLFEIPTTGLRFFTVYGPWGRPDMAPYLFTDSISKNKAIKVFNHGNMERDFTFISDITEGVFRVIKSDTSHRKKSKELYKLYNIGNSKSVKLLDFIEQIELNLNIKAIKNMMPIQPGDVEKTWADIDSLIQDYDYKPTTSIQDGVQKYVKWYLNHYKN
jgi:UDP-glucuronate 4-epimerase